MKKIYRAFILLHSIFVLSCSDDVSEQVNIDDEIIDQIMEIVNADTAAISEFQDEQGNFIAEVGGPSGYVEDGGEEEDSPTATPTPSPSQSPTPLPSNNIARNQANHRSGVGQMCGLDPFGGGYQLCEHGLVCIIERGTQGQCRNSSILPPSAAGPLPGNQVGNPGSGQCGCRRKVDKNGEVSYVRPCIKCKGGVCTKSIDENGDGIDIGVCKKRGIPCALDPAFKNDKNRPVKSCRLF